MAPVEVSDEQVKKEIVDHMYWSDRVDASDVSVDVTDNEVTLSGEVDSLRMKQDVEDLVYDIGGVFLIDNQLEVSPVLEEEAPDNDEIRRRVEGVLAWDSDIDPTRIDVMVTDRVVTLKGTVDEKWKVTYALSKAGELEGVIDVKNELSVVPDLDIEDESIADKLMSAFERNASIDPDPLEVRVEDGEVYLEGAVADLEQSASVYETTIQTPGVKRVIDNTTIKSPRPEPERI